jgi:hypothetical protein
VTHGQFAGSFLQFIPYYFNGLYGFGGNFAWMGLHLWYLLILFIFSAVMLPVFRKLRDSRFFLLQIFFTKPHSVILLFIPVAAVEVLVDLFPRSIGIRDFGGWSLFTYLTIFFLGYIIASDDRFRNSMEQIRFTTLLMGLIAMGTGGAMLIAFKISSYHPVSAFLRGFNTCMWLFAFYGFAIHHLNSRNRFLERASEALMPFYILHQSVIVITGYFIINWDIVVFPKYLFLLTASFIVIILLYESAIKRYRLLRIFFGMK